MYIFIPILSILFVILLISYIVFRKTFLFTKEASCNLYHGLDGDLDEINAKKRFLIERLDGIPYRDVYIKSYDGLTLHARYYHSSDDAALAIQFHGYKSMAGKDFSGGAYEFISRNQNVLLVDQRAHGKSDGSVITFGVKERQDVKSWINYSIETFGKEVKIILYGVSMGAATVIMASELSLPENVVGIVADCPYSSPREILKKVIRDMRLPANLLYPFVRLGALIYGRFDPDSASPVSAVKNTDIPILIIHGDGDDFVPHQMSEKIKDSGDTVTFVKIKDATHALSYIYDYDRYMGALIEFIKNVLGDKNEKL